MSEHSDIKKARDVRLLISEDTGLHYMSAVDFVALVSGRTDEEALAVVQKAARSTRLDLREHVFEGASTATPVITYERAVRLLPYVGFRKGLQKDKAANILTMLARRSTRKSLTVCFSANEQLLAALDGTVGQWLRK